MTKGQCGKEACKWVCNNNKRRQRKLNAERTVGNKIKSKSKSKSKGVKAHIQTNVQIYLMYIYVYATFLYFADGAEGCRGFTAGTTKEGDCILQLLLSQADEKCTKAADLYRWSAAAVLNVY